MRSGELITIRRPWGTSKQVEFAGLVRVTERKLARVAYRAQVHWPPVGGHYDIELEQGRLMRSATKPFDPPWIIDRETLAELVRMAEIEFVRTRDERKLGRVKP